MNNRTKLISIVLFLSALMMFVSCQQQKAEWKGTIEEVDGVTVVKNPKMPMYGEDVFSLEEDLSITDRGDNKKYFFTGLCSIAVDDKENIFLCDQREGHILKFDRDGNYIRKIGRMGKGPGEFNAPSLVICTSQREIAVNDRDQLSFFSLDGDFLRSLPKRRKSIYTIDIDNEGNIYGSKRILEKESPRWELQKFDSELNYLYTVTSTPYYIIGRKITPFPLVLRWDLMSDGRLVYGYPDKYEIKIVDSDGNLIRKIEKNYDPVEWTKDEIKEAEESTPPGFELDISKFHSAYRWIFVGNKNRIYVETWELSGERNKYLYDVFDSEGKYIAKIPSKSLQKSLLFWKKDKFYAIEIDEEGYFVVKRYKVTWKY